MFTRNRLATFLAASVVTITTNASFGGASMKVDEKFIVGHELRLLVETSRESMAFMAHSTTVTDVKGYLVIVDLASSEPTIKRSHVYGPLWNIPQPRSELSFSAGVNFTKEDEDAALATPHCEFDDAGNLVRFRNDLANKKILFDRLDLPTATFKQAVSFTPIDDQAPPMSEDQVISPNGRYMLLYQNNKAKLFDLYTGQEKPDPWLTARFAEARRIPTFQNVMAFFTDDLDHIVVNPRGTWGGAFGTTTYTTFDLAGKTYSRADYFLCADRPEPKLALIQRKFSDQNIWQLPPQAVFAVDGKLLLMAANSESIKLYKRDGTVVYHSEAKVPTGWYNGAQGTQHLAKDAKLIFFNVDLNDMDQVLDRHIAFTSWGYLDGTVKSDIVHLIDLFQQHNGQYVIRDKPTAVK